MAENSLLEKKIKTGITLLDFTADWCAPCKAQKPMIENIISTYENRVSVIEINIDEQREIATRYMVQSIPTLIIFKNGKEMRRFVGIQSETNIAKNLDQFI